MSELSLLDHSPFHSRPRYRRRLRCLLNVFVWVTYNVGLLLRHKTQDSLRRYRIFIPAHREIIRRQTL